jgi:hypothetical protein
MNGTTSGHWLPRRRAGVLAAAAAGVTVFAAGCGSSSGPASPATPAAHRLGYAQYHGYSQCLRSHGAPFWPEPSQIPQGVFDNPNTYKIAAWILAREHGPGWRAALAACQQLAPSELPHIAAQISALGGHLLKLATCMRARGITRFPSPVAGPYGGGFPRPGPGVDPDSAQFRAA